VKSIRAAYERVIDSALSSAASLPPIAAGLTACVDLIYNVGERQLAALAQASLGETPGGRLAREILVRIRQGRGGELVVLWPDGPEWMEAVVGPPSHAQAGGNGPQAAWTLSQVGAPALLALEDRSAEQLGVLDSRILIAGDGNMVPIGDTTPEGSSAKPPHYVLEFRKGTEFDGQPLPRSTRIMIRFSNELERDELFASRVIGNPQAPLTLLSGLTTQPGLASDDARWMASLADDIARSNGWVHHELSEFPTRDETLAAIGFCPAASLGMSLSELHIAAGTSRSPERLACDIATAGGFEQVVVHSDEWALIACRDPSPSKRNALILGNALAGARALAGHPSADPHVGDSVSFSEDVPRDAALGDGWHVICVPAPYTPCPKATIGLGDTFCAGLLLGEQISRIPT
jgi:hypothetical protein